MHQNKHVETQSLKRFVTAPKLAGCYYWCCKNSFTIPNDAAKFWWGWTVIWVTTLATTNYYWVTSFGHRHSLYNVSYPYTSVSTSVFELLKISWGGWKFSLDTGHKWSDIEEN